MVFKCLVFVLQIGGKHCGERRTFWLPFFPTKFSNGFFLRVVIIWDCVVKDYRGENSVGKVENASYQYNRKLFLKDFLPFSSQFVKVLCGKRL